MTTDQHTRNKHLVESFIQELFTKGDLTAVDRYVAPDFVNHDPPFPGAPEGAEGMRQAGQMMRAAVPDWRSEADHYIAEGDLIVHMDESTNHRMPGPTYMQVWYITPYEAEGRSYDEIVLGMTFTAGRRNYTSELERMRILVGKGPTQEQVEQTIASILSHHRTEPR